MNRDVLALQKELRARGLYDAKLDGIFGRLTLAGVVMRAGGPRALVIAAGEMYVSEVTGPRDNPRIRAYHAATSMGESADEVPWCSSFVNWCQLRADLSRTNSAAARSWLQWGVKCEPAVGAIAVLKRGNSSWQGHLGYVVHWTAGHVWLLGGNQGNRVCVARFSRSQVLGFRKAK
jgi:uncharacterized protein (TIGR02594 family)